MGWWVCGGMLVKQEDAVRGGGAVMLRAGRCLVLGALVQGLGPVGEAGCCKGGAAARGCVDVWV